MRKIKIKRVDTMYLQHETLHIADKPKPDIEDNELVQITFKDGTSYIVTPDGEYDYNDCETCYLHQQDKCCAWDNSKQAGYRNYVCLFQGRPVKSIDSIMEDL